MNLSFCGCGFLGAYHLGVSSCFKEHAPYLVSKVAGASMGAIAAAMFLCESCIGQTAQVFLNVATKVRSRALGPLHPGLDLNESLAKGLEKILPENAHLLCNGRLFISLTSFPDGKNVLISEFSSRSELAQVLSCSCFIPFLSGVRVPVYRGMGLYDGGLSDNLPVLDDNTITVSPFAGEHDICPRDESDAFMQLYFANTSIVVSPENIYRISRVIYPPSAEEMGQICQQGFDDALRFLLNKSLIICKSCLAMEGHLYVTEKKTIPLTKKSSISKCEEGCTDCRNKRQIALVDGLPDNIIDVLEDSCDQVNNDLVHRIFDYRLMKLLSILSIPYVLPFDISIFILRKFFKNMPLIRKGVLCAGKRLLLQFRNTHKDLKSSRILKSEKMS